MSLGSPLNDHECLTGLLDRVRITMEAPEIRDLAARFSTTGEIAAWIRSRPQLDDIGNGEEGPRIACDVPQRARVLPTNPNCFERTLMYLALAERVDPYAVRQPITIHLPQGRHTLPIENGQPVMLTDGLSRNAVDLAVWHTLNGNPSGRRTKSAPPRAGARPEGEPHDLLRWIVAIALEPATARCGDEGARRVERVARMFERMLAGAPANLFRNDEMQADLAWLFDVADEAADLYGYAGIGGVHLARAALGRLGLLPLPSCPKSAPPPPVTVSRPVSGPRNLRLPHILEQALQVGVTEGAKLARTYGPELAHQYALGVLGLSAFVPPATASPPTPPAGTTPTGRTSRTPAVPLFPLQLFAAPPATTRR